MLKISKSNKLIFVCGNNFLLKMRLAIKQQSATTVMQQLFRMSIVNASIVNYSLAVSN